MLEYHCSAELAQKHGLDAAVFLHNIVFWAEKNRANGKHFHDGRWWTYNSTKAFCELFPLWSKGQINRIINTCKEKGFLYIGNYNEDGRDRTSWYSPSDEVLEAYGLRETWKCISENQEMHLPESGQSFPENEKPLPDILPDSKHTDTPYSPPDGDKPAPDCTKKKRRKREVKTVPDWRPERFEQFWDYYGLKVNRAQAVAEWDALKPDDALIDHMARTLRRQKQSELWQRGRGIPYPSTWLHQRRWTDEAVDHPQASRSGYWADDPEVM